MLKKINAEIKVVKEYEEVMIPQANNMKRIVTAIRVMRHSPINERDIATGFAMAKRQGDYYVNAMRFLNLINTFEYGKEKIISLTVEAMEFFSKGTIEKNLRIWILDKKLLEEYEGKIEKYNSDTTTKKRRMQSLNAWKKWVENE